MARLTENTPRNEITGCGPLISKVRPEFQFYQGALLAHRKGSALIEIPDPDHPRTDLMFAGYYDGYYIDTRGKDVDSDGGALFDDETPFKVEARPGIVGPLDTGTNENQITADMIGEMAYAFDDNTVYATDANGTISFAGLIAFVDPDTGQVWIDIDQYAFAWAALGAAAAVNDAGPRPGLSRAVVTSLAACTSSGGVLTADAVGAFGTQDGIADLAVGDSVFIPKGTTNLPAASDSGPYVITTLGDGSTKWVLSRPSWWAHGSTIPQAYDIKIGGEGTKWAGNMWRSFADIDLEIGTDDPVFWPQTDAADLVSGTGVTNMWIRDTHRVTAMNVTDNHSFYASTLTAGAGNGAITITGTASEHYSVLSVNF